MRRVSGPLAALWLAASLSPGFAQEAPRDPPQDSAQPPPQEAAPAVPFVPSLPATAAGVPGTWDLSRDGSTRRCVLTLSDESGPAGRRLRFPAGCHRALPILGAIAGWLYTEAGLRLVDRDLRPILMFGRRPDRRSLLALSQTGETYSLVPLEIAGMAPRTPVAEVAAAGPAEAKPAAAATGDAPVESASVPKAQGTAFPRAEATGTVPPSHATAATEGGPPAALFGVYALDRYREKDVCRLDLAAGGAASAPVRILDGCRDSGLAVFDPVSWSFSKGRLTLAAKRGHTVALVPAGEGLWRREPETGTTFVLRRIEP